MSSSEGYLADTPEMDLDDFTPPSSTSNSIKASQSSRNDSFSPINPTPDKIFSPELEVSPNLNDFENKANTTTKIKVEFFEDDERTHARFSSDAEIIDIMTSLLRSSDPDHKKSAINKLLKSDLLGQEIADSVIRNLSKKFSDFLSNKECPLRSKDILSNVDQIDHFNMENILEQCKLSCPDVVEAVEQILFGRSQESDKQRLLTVIMIGGYTRNQKVNFGQKLIGEFLKRKNCSKQGLELLQRCGVTLVSKSISRDQDTIGENFLTEVKKRKQEIEIWHSRRKNLESLVTSDLKKYNDSRDISRSLKVKFVADEFSPKINELGK